VGAAQQGPASRVAMDRPNVTSLTIARDELRSILMITDQTWPKTRIPTSAVANGARTGVPVSGMPRGALRVEALVAATLFPRPAISSG